MNRTIQADLYRYNGETSLLKGLMIPGFRYTYFFRKASEYKRCSFLGIFYRIIRRWVGHKYGFQFQIGASIGEGFHISHRGTVIIGSKVKKGNNCNITHNTTIGLIVKGKLKGYPTIGNNVWIGTGSVIVGKNNHWR